MQYILYCILQDIQEGYAGQSGLKGEKGEQVKNCNLWASMFCVQNPTLCPGLGINDYSAV